MTVSSGSRSLSVNSRIVQTDLVWLAPYVYKLGDEYVVSDVNENFQHVSWSSDSVSSPNYWVKSYIKVPYQPKKPMSPPVYPIYYNPRRPILWPQRSNQSNRSFNKSRRNFEVKLQRYDLLVQHKKLVYLKRLEKYNARLGFYNQQQARISSGRLKKVRSKNRHVLPDNPYSRTTTVLVPLTGYITVYNRYIGYGQNLLTYQKSVGLLHETIPWQTGSFNEELSALLASAESRAFGRYMSSLGDQSVHLANIIAERHQTVELISSTLKRLLQLVKNFNIKFIASSVYDLLNVYKNRKLANDTLAFLFGAKPLMQDIYAAAELLEQKENPDVLIIRGKSKKHSTITNSTVTVPGFNWVVTTIITVKVSYVFRYRISNPLTFELQALGLINPAEVLWEKMPWSFVIDWVLPVGTWIHSLTSDVGLEYLSGTRTQTVTINHSAKLVVDKPESSSSAEWIDWASGFGMSSKVVVTKDRQVYATPPTVRMPKFKSPLSIYHVTESLALLRQQLKKKLF